jgi:hypothetical protein
MQNLRQTVSVEAKVTEKEDQIIKVLMKIVKSVTALRDREILIEIREGTRETHKIKKKDALITKTDPREETKRGNPSDPQNRKPRRRKNKNHSDSKRNDTRNEPKLIKKEEKVPKKSGLGGFISKLFGG